MEINNQKYINLIIKNLWLIVVAMILTGGISYSIRSRQPATYSSSVQLLIGSIETPNPEIAALDVSERLALTYAELIRSYTLLDETIAELGLSLSPEQLAQRISTRVIDNTSILVITISYTDPNQVAAIANALADNLIQSTPSELTEDEQTQMERTRDQIEQLEDLITTTSNQSLSVLEELNAARDRGDQESVDSLSDQYNRLADQLVRSQATLAQQSEIFLTLANRVNRLEITSPARPNFEASGLSPNVAAILGAAAGSMLAVGGILLIGFLDTTIYNEEAAETLTKRPLLASISKTRIKGIGISREIVMLHQPDSPAAENFRALTLNLVYANEDEDITSRTLMIASANPKDGRTFITANLAVSIAQNDTNVLLVDTDTKAPRIHEIFDLPANQKGLADALTWIKNTSLYSIPAVEKSKLLRNFIYVHPEIPTLSIIPCGITENIHSMSILNNKQRLADFINLLKEVMGYPIILLDASASLSYVDSFVVAAKTEAEIIMVVRQKNTNFQDVLKVKNQYEKLDREVRGIVLNQY